MTTTCSWYDNPYDPDDPTPTTPRPGGRGSGRRRKRRSPLEKFARHIDREADRLHEVADLIRRVETSTDGKPAPKRPAADEDKLRHLARSGVIDFELHFRPNGWADVHACGIDFTLAPTRAKLLFVLAADNGRCDDERLVGWKKLEDVLDMLEKHFHAAPSVETFWTWKYRLVGDLEKAGLTRYFIELSSDNELRFTRRREGAR